jgi:hypothetical protein
MRREMMRYGCLKRGKDFNPHGQEAYTLYRKKFRQ